MNRLLRLLSALVLAPWLAAATPGLSLNLVQGVFNSDQPFGLGVGGGFTVLFREKESVQGRLRIEYLSLGKGSGVPRSYFDYTTPPYQPRTYSTASHGDLVQAAYDWRIALGDGGTRLILGVGYFQLHTSLNSGINSNYESDWQRIGATGTFGFGWALGPKADLELRYNHYQAVFLVFPVEGDVNLKPSNLALALQVRF